MFHEPYYDSYLEEDLGGMFAERGLPVRSFEPVFLAKMMVCERA
jgi:hypothetical protein